MEGDPSAAQELKRLGICLVPVLLDGDRAFHGWNPKELARFLGVNYAEGTPLPPAELAWLLGSILEAAGSTSSDWGFGPSLHR